MTVNNWLLQASHDLEKAEVETAHLDALILLEDCVARDRAWLLAHLDYQLSAPQVRSLKKLLTRRAMHEPLAYVRGRCEFYNHEFVLTSSVLQPRPESEVFIELLQTLLHSDDLRSNSATPIRITDVGTGSGALGITAALEVPNSHVELLEIDPQAVEVAQTNVDKFTLNISVIRSDLLTSARQPADILLCNLPYVPDDYQVNRAALYEPSIALFGGEDGLDIYRRLFNQVRQHKFKPLFILTESFEFQHKSLEKIAGSVGYRLVKTHDFVQVFQYNMQFSKSTVKT
jgi:release factor glutamine methyltransferase